MKYNICSDFNCNLKSIAVKVGWNFVLISSLSHSWLKIQQNFILFLQSFNQLFGLYSYISAYCAEEIIQLEIIATIPLSIRGHVSSKHCFVHSSYPMYGPLCLPCAAFQSGSILRGDLVRQVLHSRLGNFFWVVVLNCPFNVLSPMCPHSFMIRQVERLEPSGVPSGHLPCWPGWAIKVLYQLLKLCKHLNMRINIFWIKTNTFNRYSTRKIKYLVFCGFTCM